MGIRGGVLSASSRLRGEAKVWVGGKVGARRRHVDAEERAWLALALALGLGLGLGLALALGLGLGKGLGIGIGIGIGIGLG